MGEFMTLEEYEEEKKQRRERMLAYEEKDKEGDITMQEFGAKQKAWEKIINEHPMNEAQMRMWESLKKDLESKQTKTPKKSADFQMINFRVFKEGVFESERRRSKKEQKSKPNPTWNFPFETEQKLIEIQKARLEHALNYHCNNEARDYYQKTANVIVSGYDVIVTPEKMPIFIDALVLYDRKALEGYKQMLPSIIDFRRWVGYYIQKMKFKPVSSPASSSKESKKEEEDVSFVMPSMVEQMNFIENDDLLKRYIPVIRDALAYIYKRIQEDDIRREAIAQDPSVKAKAEQKRLIIGAEYLAKMSILNILAGSDPKVQAAFVAGVTQMGKDVSKFTQDYYDRDLVEKLIWLLAKFDTKKGNEVMNDLKNFVSPDPWKSVCLEVLGFFPTDDFEMENFGRYIPVIGDVYRDAKFLITAFENKVKKLEEERMMARLSEGGHKPAPALPW